MVVKSVNIVDKSFVLVDDKGNEKNFTGNPYTIYTVNNVQVACFDSLTVGYEAKVTLDEKTGELKTATANVKSVVETTAVVESTAVVEHKKK